MEIKLTKEQQDKIAQTVKRIDNLERNSDSKFIARFFNEIIDSKIVNFSIISMSNKLTKPVTNEFYNTYVWLKAGKDVFKNATDNKMLSVLTDYVYNLLSIVEPEKFKSDLVDIVNMKFSKDYRNKKKEYFKAGDYFLYGATVYCVVMDTGDILRLQNFNKENGEIIDSFDVDSSDTRAMLRERACMAIMPEKRQQAERNGGLYHGPFRPIAESFNEPVNNNVVRVDPLTRHLGGGVAADIATIEGELIVRYERVNYAIRGIRVINNMMLFDFRELPGAEVGILRRLYVSARFIQRNGNGRVPSLLRWYRAQLGPDADMIDPTLANYEAQYGVQVPGMQMDNRGNIVRVGARGVVMRDPILEQMRRQEMERMEAMINEAIPDPVFLDEDEVIDEDIE